ncbi:MAG: hypothetical protein LBD71_06965 [Treponema sp.]|jgi:hypothetical protein|nr:hypothetical protein [Treponema sp.]
MKPTAFFLAASLFLAACNTGTSSPVTSPLVYTQTVYLNNQSLFLVKVNRSDYNVGYNYTGSASSVGDLSGGRSAVPGALVPRESGGEISADPAGLDAGETFVRREHERSQKFNSNPPPLPAETLLPRRPRAFPPVVGDPRDFHVEDSNGNFTSVVSTTLKAQSSKANVWIADDNFDNSSSANDDQKLTMAQAEALADKFNTAYNLVTNVFGYEYGAAYGQPLGGKDGDERIQILVYDIDYDYSSTQTSGTFGYFWNKDFYTQTELDSAGLSNIKTNDAEIMYIDAHFTDCAPDMIYSTLIHEFQHMIHFNEKYVRRGKRSETWYNEMLSMLAEDMIAPMIGVTGPNNLPMGRFPWFIRGYSEGISRWLSGSDVYFSYANAYAFGAYLARNLGGPALVEAMAKNNYVNKDSISAALAAVSPAPDVKNFDRALYRFAETLVYNGAPAGRFSFGRAASGVIGGNTYTFNGINIRNWNNSNIYSPADVVINAGGPGPLIFSLKYLFGMPPNSVLVQSRPEWQNFTGVLTVTFTLPLNPFIDQYLLIR